MPFGAIAGGLAAGIGGAVVTGAMSGGGGGGGSSQSSTASGSLGQGIGNILAGGLSTALGIEGLTGGNANQLQAGAAAANPFGQYSSSYQTALSQLLLGNSGINNASAGAQGQEMGLLQQLLGSAGINTGAGNLPTQIGTNTGALSAMGNISTPGQSNNLQSMVNNPTQLLQALQGGVQTPSSIQSILSQNPYQMTSGEQFQEQTGLDTLNRSLAQTGQIGSGNQMVAAEQYGQNFASQATQQNITNLLGAQQSVNQTSTTNQGIQGLLNQMGQNQFGNQLNLASLLTGQQQQSFSNQLGTQQLQTQQQQGTASASLAQQQLQSSQQQNSQVNLQNLLQQMMGVNQTGVNNQLGQLQALLTASQANSSSPATAGGILANLGVANQTSGGNVASGLAGLGQGVGQLLNGVNFGSGGSNATGSENFGAESTSTPDDLIAGYTGY